MLKKILLVFLVLGVIGSLLPDNEENSSKATNTVAQSQKKESNDNMASANKEQVTKKEKESVQLEKVEEKTIVYSKDKETNEIIIRYNTQNPDDPIELDMVGNWKGAAPDDVTEVEKGAIIFKVSFAEGDPRYNCLSNIEHTRENKEQFIDESIKWIRATYDFVDESTAEKMTEFFYGVKEGSYSIGKNYFIYEEDVERVYRYALEKSRDYNYSIRYCLMDY